MEVLEVRATSKLTAPLKGGAARYWRLPLPTSIEEALDKPLDAAPNAQEATT